MNLATVIASLALIIIVGLALWYIIKEKKKGNKCVGCPYAGECCKYSFVSHIWNPLIRNADAG